MLRGILTYCPVAHHPCKGQGEEEGNGAGHGNDGDDDYDDDDNDDDEEYDKSGVGDNRIKWWRNLSTGHIDSIRRISSQSDKCDRFLFGNTVGFSSAWEPQPGSVIQSLYFL